MSITVRESHRPCIEGSTYFIFTFSSPLIFSFACCLLGVDPFLGGYDAKDAMSTTGFANITSRDWAAGILHNMHAFGCRFRLHWGDSVAMSAHFANQSIDCIFIDGDHTYNGDIFYLYSLAFPSSLLHFY